MWIAGISAQSFRMPRLLVWAIFVRMRLAAHSVGETIYCTLVSHNPQTSTYRPIYFLLKWTVPKWLNRKFITPVFVALVLADDPVIPSCEMSPPQGRPDSLRTGGLISARRDCVVKQRNAVLVLGDRRRRPSGGPQSPTSRASDRKHKDIGPKSPIRSSHPLII